MNKKLATVTLILTLTSSCYSMPKSWDWGLKGRPISGTRGFPEVDTDYGKGFKMGCAIAWSTTHKGLIESVDREVDPLLMSQSVDYSNGWWDGYEQCTYVGDHDVV